MAEPRTRRATAVGQTIASAAGGRRLYSPQRSARGEGAGQVFVDGPPH